MLYGAVLVREDGQSDAAHIEGTGLMTEQPGAERKPGEGDTAESTGQAAPESGAGSADPWAVDPERPDQPSPPDEPERAEPPAEQSWGQSGQGGQPQWGQPAQGQPQWGQPGQGQPQWGQPGQSGQPGQWGQPPQQGQPAQWGQPGQQWGQPGQPGQAGQQWGQPGYYPPGYGPPQTEQGAIWALVSAIGAWVVCPIILAIVALVLASNADKKIKASGHVLQGDGMVVAARVIAWANIILILGGFALALVIGGIAASTN